MSGSATVSKALGDSILLSQDHLQEILLNMVLLDEPYEEYERLMVILAYLADLSEDISEKAAKFRETGHENVIFTEFMKKPR